MFALLLAGTLDFGGAFSAWIAMGNMARAGAQRGTIGGLYYDGSATATETAMQTAAYAEQATIFGVTPTVTPSGPTADAYGYCMVTVTVTYNYTPLVHFPPIPSSITMHRTVNMRTQIDNTVGCN
jgi:hypothetical protein